MYIKREKILLQKLLSLKSVITSLSLDDGNLFPGETKKIIFFSEAERRPPLICRCGAQQAVD
jgi:hypothetical protein